MVDDTSSYYSQESIADRYPSCISPLRIQKASEPKHLSILQAYTDERNSARGSDKGSQEHEQRGTADEASSGAELAYTPLAPFLRQGAPTVRKASKTLIGEGGWLENTLKPESTTSPTRGGGFLGNLVKKAKEMVSNPLPFFFELPLLTNNPRSKQTKTTAPSANPVNQTRTKKKTTTTETTNPSQRPPANSPSPSARASKASSTANSSSP